mmetsp:Transcript_29805/g.48509  ORF Transcript_29805/g.48509 Transcript_29805/m.48509 type:complete len:500 (-) Transcript_29805:268-1767(-)
MAMRAAKFFYGFLVAGGAFFLAQWALFLFDSRFSEFSSQRDQHYEPPPLPRYTSNNGQSTHQRRRARAMIAPSPPHLSTTSIRMAEEVTGASSSGRSGGGVLGDTIVVAANGGIGENNGDDIDATNAGSDAGNHLEVSDRVHVFYYPWYGTPSVDGEWQHWNHEIMPHWTQSVTDRYPKGKHPSPGEIGANFYPILGPYSSMNASVLHTHFNWIRRAGAGVCVVSWYPPGRADPAQAASIEHSDKVVPLLLRAGEATGVKIAFHIEPYKGRDASSVASDIRYIVDMYGGSPAFYRSATHGDRPVVYVYDSYHTPAHEWARVLSPSGIDTIRGGRYDAVVLALWVRGEQPQSNSGIEDFFVASHFDGAYTYFAGSRFAWASNPGNWRALRETTQRRNLLFCPSVGPGYIDTRVRPWNGGNTISRRGGQHYDQVFGSALAASPDFISVTSFNEWHEGTQIEPATRIDDIDDSVAVAAAAAAAAARKRKCRRPPQPLQEQPQ